MTKLRSLVSRGLPSAGLFLGLALAARAQDPAALPPAAPAPGPTASAPAGLPTETPGMPIPAEAGAVAAPTVPPNVTTVAAVPSYPAGVQLVRIQGPTGLQVELLGPPGEILGTLPGDGLFTAALNVNTGYWLRLWNIPDRPGEDIHLYLEVVGHLHRPPGIDPTKYPIRVMIQAEDIDDVLDRGQMVTHIVYLEDPEQAIPLHLPKTEIPVVSLNPAEDPMRVAAALGRVMAIARLGRRVPTPEEAAGGATVVGAVGGPCPFVASDGGRCPLTCGPVDGTPPPPGRPWVPRDEFLCDGGDQDPAVHSGGEGGLRGLDPRDTVMRFRDDRRNRVLPTNTVCVYAPRFAAVRSGMGPNEAQVVQTLRGAEQVQSQLMQQARQHSLRMTQNQSPEANRSRARASGLINRIGAQNHFELRVLDGLDLVTHVAGHAKDVGPQMESLRQKAGQMRERLRPEGIQTGEGLVVTGIVEGASENVMAWKPQEVASVEEPPNKPGMAVVKQVSAAEAEPGDPLTYTISYRNMGNVPITSVSIVDSLLPRLEYVRGSARGPAGSVFTASENRAGSVELRWDIGTVAPGATGAVSFQVTVR